MALPKDLLYQEFGKVLASRLKKNCTPVVKAALDQCWISHWHCPKGTVELADLPETSPTLKVLVLHSCNVVAISCLSHCWQEVLTAWQDLTGSMSQIALFQISGDGSYEDLQPILFESLDLIENDYSV